MLTLKILYRDGCEWVGDVMTVTETAAVKLPDDWDTDTALCDDSADADRAGNRPRRDVLDLFGPTADGSDQVAPRREVPFVGTIHAGTYHPGQIVKAIVVATRYSRTEAGQEATWIVPANDTYLLGDDGRTIDRI